MDRPKYCSLCLLSVKLNTSTCDVPFGVWQACDREWNSRCAVSTSINIVKVCPFVNGGGSVTQTSIHNCNFELSNNAISSDVPCC
jgi:hypothetical protein